MNVLRAIALLLALALAACGQGRAQEEPVDLSAAEQLARVSIPAQARDLRVHQERGIDGMVALRFVLDRAELPAFVAAAGYAEPLQPDFRPFTSRELPGVDWWRPDDAGQVAGATRGDAGWASELMVVLDDPAEVTVYLKAYEL